MPNKSSPKYKPEGMTIDEIIEWYKEDVDMTLLEKNLKLTPTQRLEQAQEVMRLKAELQKHRTSK